jgi:hypothetical protein
LYSPWYVSWPGAPLLKAPWSRRSTSCRQDNKDL